MRGIEEPPVRVYLVWSNEHDAWWRPNRCGYTGELWDAGRYTESDAAEICRKASYGWRGGSPPPEVMVSAPENDQDKFTVDDLRHLADRMRNRVVTATSHARAARRVAEQGGEVTQ